jgi:DNA-directed RNA polymerase subunit RPC12/RpoP
MDVIFNCPKCDQELAVDSSGSGSQIECPSCGEDLIIPEAESVAPRASVAQTDGAVAARVEARHANPIASSAAAKIELHLKVPSHKTAQSLISKPLPPMEVAAVKDAEKRLKVKTIKHTDCIEVGHDRFDEVVSNFLGKVGESSIVSLTPLTYTFLDIGTQKLLTEFGVLIVYRG